MTTYLHHGMSTFGAPLSLADDLSLSDEITSATTPYSLASVREVRDGLERDQRLALAGRRWSENDDGFLVHDAEELVPGDVVAIRRSAVVQLMRSIGGFAEDAPNRNLAMERLEATSRLVYSATPYWLDSTSAWGVMAIKPLTDEDRGELRLASPSLVQFSSGMEISGPYLDMDPTVMDRLALDLEPGSCSATVANAEAHAPVQVRSGSLEVLRYLRGRGSGEGHLLFRYELLGVLLVPTHEGGLADPVWWLLHGIDPPPGATSQSMAIGDRGGRTRTTSRFFLLEGRLSRALLRPIAEALAAVISWGSWDSPARLEVPPPSELRKAVRRSSFKKAERAGAAAGVQMLRLREPSLEHQSEVTSGGRPVATHWRRGHWRRVRVGKRGDWHYERRRIPGRIINSGQDPVGDRVRVYRLPPPPDE